MLFRKKFKRSLKDEAAIKVVNFLLKVQIKFSKVMRDYTKNIAVKNLKILLVGFCLLGGGTSTYLITAAIFKDGQPALKIEKIKIPIYDKDSDLQTGSYEFQNFRRYMDSLQQIKLDSKIRPNSIDSLKILKIYKSYEK
jgi:hypothetical protein